MVNATRDEKLLRKILVEDLGPKQAVPIYRLQVQGTTYPHRYDVLQVGEEREEPIGDPDALEYADTINAESIPSTETLDALLRRIDSRENSSGDERDQWRAFA